MEAPYRKVKKIYDENNNLIEQVVTDEVEYMTCLLYTSPLPSAFKRTCYLYKGKPFMAVVLNYFFAAPALGRFAPYLERA